MPPREALAVPAGAWRAQVYRGDVPQLTARAVATGLVLGAVLSFANVYIGLRTGWFFSMALVACLLSFGGWRVLAVLGARPLGLLEANAMQSTASSAAYATGNMMVGVVPALLLLSVSAAAPRGVQPAWPAIAAWVAISGVFGVLLAIPLKRQLIDHERLPFPSGTAAAVVLDALHRGADGVRTRTRWLFGGLVAGAVLSLLRDLRGLAVIGRSSAVFDWLPALRGRPVSDAGVVVDHSFLLVAAGVFVGVRVAVWLVIGGLLTAFVIGPGAIDHGVPTTLGMAWVDVGLWIGAPLLVAYALVAMASNLRAVGRTLRGLRTVVDATDADLQIPSAWFWIGFAICAVFIVVLGRVLFAIPLVLGCLAVPLSVVFAIVACRVNGETDITPGGPIAKLTQLAFGVVRPGQPSTNLMLAALTHASSTASSDLLNDLKSGHLLGANPRKQFIAQALGITAGTAASVAAYFLLVPDATALHGPEAFAAPAAHQFQAIAVLLQRGLDSLHPVQQKLVVIGAIAGTALSISERLVPPRLRRWWPAPAGLGLGLLMPFATSFAMLVGAVLAAVVVRRRPAAEDGAVWPLAAGLLAGESIAGVLAAAINTLL